MPDHRRDEEALRDWLVEQGHIKPEERDTIALRACRMPDWAGDEDAEEGAT